MSENSGFAKLSDFRAGQPTMICGLGRSGTSALACWVARSGAARFVADEVSLGSTFEIAGINSAIQAREGVLLAKFRARTSAEYDPQFFFKSPMFETYQRDDPSLSSAWAGANLIVMVRDVVATALREASVDREGLELGEYLVHTARRVTVAVLGATELSVSMGVALVSYEKLLSSPAILAHDLNEWFGREIVSMNRWADCVEPNSRLYLLRQFPNENRSGQDCVV